MNIDYAQAWLDAFFTGGKETCDFYAEDGIFEDPIIDQVENSAIICSRPSTTWSRMGSSKMPSSA